MRLKEVFCLLGVLIAVSSCGVLTRSGGANPVEFDPAVAGYTGDLKTTFYYTEGMKSALMYGDLKNAIKLYDKAIELDSTHSAAYFEAANALISSEPSKALEYSIKANALDSTNLWYQTQLGRLMLLTQNYDKAFSIYENLTKKLPTEPDNYRLLAALYQQNNQPFTAISILDSAEYKVGRIEELAAYKRQLLIDVKLFDKAISESKAMVLEFPFKEENYVILAELYAAKNKDSLALATYDQAMALNPTNPDVLASLNDYYKAKGDNINFLATTKQLFLNDNIELKSKIDFFNNLAKNKQFYGNYFFQMNGLASILTVKYPGEYDALELYAGHLIASGSMDQALLLYKGHVSDSLPRIEVFNNILDMEAYLNHPDSVSKYSELALRAFPLNSSLYIRKGSILSYMKQDKEALKTYLLALKYAPTDSVKSIVYGIMGDVYHQQNKKSKSYTNYNKALKLNPDNVSVLNNYSYFLSTGTGKIDDLTKSLEMAQKAVNLAPNNPTFLDSYAWILYKLKRYEEAKKIMQQAISLDRSQSSELLIHYGDILYEMGDYFMTSVYWQKALEAGHDADEIAEKMKLIEGKL